METAQKIIVYDNSCPMCQAYTQGFVKWGVLDAQNRIAFRDLDPQQAGRYLDLQRSRHEIPLLDLAGGPTLYGVDAVTYLISLKIPVVGTLMRNGLINRFFSSLYSFVSYNRRVITATAPATGDTECTPDFHWRYRRAFIVFAAIVSGLAGWGFGVSAGYYFPQSFGWIASFTGGFFSFALLLAAVLFGGKTASENKTATERIGQLAVVMLIGALLLLPGLFLDSLMNHRNPVWLITGALLSFFVMGRESIRRYHHLKTIAEPAANRVPAYRYFRSSFCHRS